MLTFLLPLLPLTKFFRLPLGHANELRDQVSRDPVLPGRLILGEVLFLAGVDDAVDLVRSQLVQFAFFVVEARKLILSLSGLDLLLEQAFRIT